MATITEEPEQLDSGMGSSDARSPEVKTLLPFDDEEDEEDETLTERLIGLTEMFPEKVRNISYDTAVCMKNCVKERAQMEEAQRNQQKQVLLGPTSAMSGPTPSGFPMAPPIQR